MKKYIIGFVAGFLLSLIIFMNMLGEITNRINYNTMHNYDKEFNIACEQLYGKTSYNIGCKIYYLIWKVVKYKGVTYDII